LLNRALDKPAQWVKVMGNDGGPIVISWQREDEEQVLQLPGEIDGEIRRVRTVEGHVESNSPDAPT